MISARGAVRWGDVAKQQLFFFGLVLFFFQRAPCNQEDNDIDIISSIIVINITFSFAKHWWIDGGAAETAAGEKKALHNILCPEQILIYFN